MYIFFIFFFLLLNQEISFSHHKIYSPRVQEGRQSLEWRGHFNHDDRDEFNKEHHHVFETEYSWNSFWQSELEFHVADKGDTPLDWEKTEFQNQVQIFGYKNYAGALYFSYNFVSEKQKADEIEYLLKESFPDAIIKIDDLAGDGNHYAATIIATEFKGLNRVRQHQLVYAALKGKMDGSQGELHALALTTKVME